MSLVFILLYNHAQVEVRSWFGVSARHRGGVFLAILSFLHLFIRMQLMEQYLRVELCCSSLPEPLCLVTIRLVLFLFEFRAPYLAFLLFTSLPEFTTGNWFTQASTCQPKYVRKGIHLPAICLPSLSAPSQNLRTAACQTHDQFSLASLTNRPH